MTKVFSVTKKLVFNNEMEMKKFLFDNAHLFSSWSEDTISDKSYRDGKVDYDKDGRLHYVKKGWHDNSVEETMRMGYKVWDYDKNLVFVHFRNKEAFKEVENMFDKVLMRRNSYKYVFKGEV